MSTLIGLGGQLRAGKDAVGDYLADNQEFTKIGMSDPLHEITLALNPRVKLDYPIRMGYLWAKTYETYRYRDIIDAVGYVEAKKHGEVREWLQTLGTEVGRDMLYENVWVDVAKKKISRLLSEGHNVVLTATRFPNEIEMIRALGGKTVWIERDEALRLSKPLESGFGTWTPEKGSSLADGAHSALQQHSSENSLGPDDFDITISNNGTLEELYAKVDDVLK